MPPIDPAGWVWDGAGNLITGGPFGLILSCAIGPNEERAKLIAAAPDLADFAQRFVDDPPACAVRGDQAAGLTGCDCWACERVRDARAALRKAGRE